MPDEHIISLITEEQQRTGEAMPVNSLLVLNVLKQNRRMTLNEILDACNIPEAKLKATLERLHEAGLVEAMGNGKGRAYVLSAKSYRNPVQYVRQTDIDALRYKELILKLAKTKQIITRKDVIELLHVSGPQAYRLLKKLVDEGSLRCEGNRNTAKYHLN